MKGVLGIWSDMVLIGVMLGYIISNSMKQIGFYVSMIE